MSGVAVKFDFAPVGAIEKKLSDGVFADVVILSQAAIANLVKQHKLVAESVRVLGRTSIGVCIRQGMPQPDIATPEAFRSLLLLSPTIALSDVAVGGTAARYLPQLFERLGLTAVLERKLIRCAGGGDVTQRVVRGEAAIGITFVSEMISAGGADIVGPLPEAYRNDTTYCVGVMTQTAQRTQAAALATLLQGPASEDVWARAGFVRGAGVEP